MFPVAKPFQMGLVVLTALMTLVAGAPRVDCVCPNGNVKVFCLKALIGSEGCCCDDMCCETSSGAQTKPFAKKSCCDRPGEPTTHNSQKTKNCPCRRTLVEATSSVIASSPEAPRQANAGEMAAIEFSPVQIEVCEASAVINRSPPQPLPPTDLLSTFKHLLI
jgi:hypothetical protein